MIDDKPAKQISILTTTPASPVSGLVLPLELGVELDGSEIMEVEEMSHSV